MIVRPRGRKVLITPDDPVTRTAGGLYIPDTGRERPVAGRVKACGPGDVEGGPIGLRIGDNVLYVNYASLMAPCPELGGDILVNDSEIIAVLEDRDAKEKP